MADGLHRVSSEAVVQVQARRLRAWVAGGIGKAGGGSVRRDSRGSAVSRSSARAAHAPGAGRSLRFHTAGVRSVAELGETA